jgi:hypothetical protein
MPITKKEDAITKINQFAGAKANRIINGKRIIPSILLIKNIIKMY